MNKQKKLEKELADTQKNIVDSISKEIGFAQTMRLVQECWREDLEKYAISGAEYAYGPCVALTVACGCKNGCQWCNGSKWLTKHVKSIKDSMEENKDEHY